MTHLNDLTLLQLVNDKTDKNTIHSYLSLYQSLLKNKKITSTNIIEIGIDEGGSIKLWHDYFPNATIYGCDIQNSISNICDEIKNNNRIKLYTSINPYDELFINEIKDVRFDFALDNGLHTLESMIQFINVYLPLMKEDGILIIEDVQDIKWLDILISIVPQEYKNNIKTYDLRGNKNRYDDIVFVIDKSIKNQSHYKDKNNDNNENNEIIIDLNNQNLNNLKLESKIEPKMGSSLDCCLVINTCKQFCFFI